MFLKTIQLTNFRNYSAQTLDFTKDITILMGNNAQGKSNFLESIYFLATGKSPRSSTDVDLIKKEETFTRVAGELTGETSLEVAMQFLDGSFSKKVRVNGVPRRMADYVGNLAVVLFAPDDINLVTGSPSTRRYHLDLTLSQADREYKRALSSYGDVITRRNRVLRSILEGTGKLGELTFWTQQQLEFGAILSDKRVKFFEFINNQVGRFGEFHYEYHQNLLTPERLKEYQPREIASSMSLIGPHRDDFSFLLEDRDMAKFGSRGEARTSVLELKVGEVFFLEQKLGSKPLLLLDDVFSELDLDHRQQVVDLIHSQQTIIATVELDEHLEESLLPVAQIVQVKEGSLT